MENRTLTYNDAGAPVSDAGRNIAKIDYDNFSTPVRIQFTNGNVTRYVYSATGEKLRVTYQTAVPNISVAIGNTRELTRSEILYTDSIDYLLNGALTLKNGRIDKYQFDEGYCQAERYNYNKDNFTFCYYDKDHLGNIRQVTEDDNSNTGLVTQIVNYYPFGMQFCNGTTVSNAQSRKYNGKEFDNMHGLNTYDYGARQYNPATARWDRVDPLAEKYPNVSPYVYCHNNPTMLVDPDGMDDYYTILGYYLGTNKSNTDYIYIAGEYSKIQNGYTVPLSSRVRLDKANLNAEAYSKIFTNTLKLGGVDLNTLNDRKIQVTVWDSSENGVKISHNYTDKSSSDESSLAITNRDHSDGAIITAFIWPEGSEEREIFITRSNILNYLDVHERKGHYMNGYKHKKNVPDQTYKDQMDDPTWKQTTEFYKEYIYQVIKENCYGQ